MQPSSIRLREEASAEPRAALSCSPDIITMILPPNQREPASAAGQRVQPDLESIIDEQWLAWYLLSPMERWNASQEMWREYLAMGGSLEPEIDSQSPFFDLDDAVGGLPPDSPRGPSRS